MRDASSCQLEAVYSVLIVLHNHNAANTRSVQLTARLGYQPRVQRTKRAPDQLQVHL